MIDLKTLLRSPDPKQRGVFILQKSVVLEEGKDTGSAGRCDNLSYTGILVSEGTEYANHAHTFFDKTAVSDKRLDIRSVARFFNVITMHPHFVITYLEMNTWHDSEADPTPSTMWGAKSIFQLLKNMREWSFLVDAPFNSDHPMAIYSKIAIMEMGIPNALLDEIDSWQDMHLAKFLKGQDDYKLIPFPYAEPSDDMKQWVMDMVQTHTDKTFDDMLKDLW